MCCADRVSPDGATPEAWQGCALIEDAPEPRMGCYEQGFEVVASPVRTRVMAEGRVEIWPPGQAPGALGVRQHTCRAAIACPGSGETLSCEAAGPKAACLQEPERRRILCRDEDGEREVVCPPPKKPARETQEPPRASPESAPVD